MQSHPIVVNSVSDQFGWQLCFECNNETTLRWDTPESRCSRSESHPDISTSRHRISSLIHKVQEEHLVPDLRFHPFNEDEDARII
jgi:hypothetical protein